MLRSINVNLAYDYKSPADFSATYLSANTLRLTGYQNTGLSQGTQIAAILQIKADHTSRFFRNAADGITIEFDAGVLTMHGASPFVSGDIYEVGLRTQKKEHSAAVNAKMVAVRNQPQDATTAPIPIADSQTLTTDFADIGGEIDGCRGKRVFYFVHIDIGNDTDVRFKILAKHTAGSTEEYPLAADQVKVNAGVVWMAYDGNEGGHFELSSNHDHYLLIEVDTGNAISCLQLQAMAATETSNNGTVTVHSIKGY